MKKIGRRYSPPLPKNKRDPKRFQSEEMKLKTRMINNLQGIIHCIDPYWEIAETQFLRSFPGGAPQEPHQDFTNEDMENLEPDQTLASFIIPIIGHARLIVYKGCFDEPNDSSLTMLSIPMGSCIIFRGT